jgi:Tol biopolymer transport system component
VRRRWALPVALVFGLVTLGAASPAHAVVPGPNGRIASTVPGPNGRIAYARFNPAVGDDAIFTANSDGTDEVEVFAGPAEAPRWFPDGSRIAIVCFQGNFEFVRNCTMNPDGSDFVQLVPDPTLNQGVGAWSPDGMRIAFEGWDDVNPDRTPGVFSMRSSDGGDLVRITTSPYGGHDIAADYAPDGSRLVFIREDPLKLKDPTALFVVNVDGTGLRQLTPWGLQANDPRWSPDGTRIVFASKGAIFLINVGGTGLVKIRQDPAGGASFSPVWAPDGTRILFADFLITPPHEGQEDLYTMNPDGSSITRVTNTSDFEESPDWGTNQAG